MIYEDIKNYKLLFSFPDRWQFMGICEDVVAVGGYLRCGEFHIIDIRDIAKLVDCHYWNWGQDS